MTDRLRTHPQTGSGPKLFKIVDARGLPGEEYVICRALGGAEIDEFADIVVYARLAQHRVGDKSPWRKADGEAVRTRATIHMVGEPASSPAIHKFRDDGGFSRNMLLQEGQYRAHAHIGGAAGSVAVDNGNGFPLIERRLREGRIGKTPKPHESQGDRKFARAV